MDVGDRVSYRTPGGSGTGTITDIREGATYPVMVRSDKNYDAPCTWDEVTLPQRPDGIYRFTAHDGGTIYKEVRDGEVMSIEGKPLTSWTDEWTIRERIGGLPIPDGVYELTARGLTYYARIVDGEVLGADGEPSCLEGYTLGKRIGGIP